MHKIEALAIDVAWLAEKDPTDQDVRSVLAALIRRYSRDVPTTYWSAESQRSRARREREHVVPVRVLVDRMIAKPRTAATLLRTCVVIAEVTPNQRRKIGTLSRDHAALYTSMKGCVRDDLVPYAWQRYKRRGVIVLDADGKPPRRPRR